MMSSAQMERSPGGAAGAADYEGLTEAGVPSALKQQVAERLAAHRQRRAQAVGAAGEPMHGAMHGLGQAGGQKHRIAAAVAERYAATPSYHAFLAEEAERAIQQAAAAAEVAARNAEAVVVAQRELLAELAMWTAPQEFTAASAHIAEALPKPAAGPVRAAELTVRLYEELGPAHPASAAAVNSWQRYVSGARAVDPQEAEALDEEIVFRQTPVFEEHFWKHEPPVPLAANLLEFPRQLVATRRARPRLAEGPLREEAGAHGRRLRIFEVAGEVAAEVGGEVEGEVEMERGSGSSTPVSMVPEWSSIWLEAHTVKDLTGNSYANLAEMHGGTQAAPPIPQTAPLGLRLRAAAVDAGILVAGLGTFVAVAAKTAGQLRLDLPLAIGVAGTLLVLYVVYHLLFFTLGDQTPGMRCARIGFCTFTDENPTRSAMRRRILAQAVAVCPFGLGLLWALLDDDRMGWHDRISKMYQRAY